MGSHVTIVNERNFKYLKEIIYKVLWKVRGEIIFSQWVKQDSLKIVIN